MGMLRFAVSWEHPAGGRGSTGMNVRNKPALIFSCAMAAAARLDKSLTGLSAAARKRPVAALCAAFALGLAAARPSRKLGRQTE
jgi:hypothetical protein